MKHHGRPVKWIALDGGWKTGHVVAIQEKEIERRMMRGGGCGNDSYPCLLVQHSCTGELEWVFRDELQNWPPRSEWEYIIDPPRAAPLDIPCPVCKRATRNDHNSHWCVYCKQLWPLPVAEKGK